MCSQTERKCMCCESMRKLTRHYCNIGFCSFERYNIIYNIDIYIYIYIYNNKSINLISIYVNMYNIILLYNNITI